jgi:hypothetical protein
VRVLERKARSHPGKAAGPEPKNPGASHKPAPWRPFEALSLGMGARDDARVEEAAAPTEGATVAKWERVLTTWGDPLALIQAITSR